MLTTTMRFYYWRENGKITVQNMVGGYSGQKHTHTLKEFKEWKKNIDPKLLTEIK